MMAFTVMLLMTTSCADEGLTDDSLTLKQTHEVTLTFSLGLNDRLSTRATNKRQLESSDGWQRVNSMRVYLFRSDTEEGAYTYYKPTLEGAQIEYIYVDAFEKDDDPANIWGDDETEFERHQYTLSTLKLTTGYYRFVAIGRDDIDGDDDTGATWQLPTMVAGSTTFESLSASVASTSAACNELFFGYTGKEHIVADTGIYEEIVLYRVVAGVLMYVENVQATVGGIDVSSIGIIRRTHSWALNLYDKTATGSMSTLVAIEGASLVGTTPADADYVVRYDLSAATVANDVFVSTNPSNTIHPNSIRCGAFVTPQEAPTADNTLELVLCNASGEVLMSKNIKLVESDGVAVTPTLLYPLIANNIYCVGRYSNADGIDEPIDLGNPSGDIIVVHGSWQADVDINM